MIKAFSEEAWEDFCHWEKTDKKMFKRIKELVKDIDRNGNEGIGKPEALGGNLSGFWSRRIDQMNRLVYRIEDDTIQFVQCGGHYGDK